MPDNGGRRIRAVRIACDLLEALRQRGRAGVTELADAVGYSKSTVYSHLQTLDDAGYVTRDDAQYRLSYRHLQFAAHLQSQIPAFDVARQRLAGLATTTGEIALFSTAEDGRLVYLYRATNGREADLVHRQAEAWSKNLYETTDQEPEVLPGPGTTAPLHSTAAGKAVLARMDRGRIADILDRHGLERRTHNTITDRETLFSELNEVDDRGYAISHEESIPGIRAVGVSVTVGDQFVGALSLLGPVNRLQDGRISNEIYDLLSECSDAIARSVGPDDPD